MPKKANHFRGLGPAGALAKLNSLPTTRIDTPYESPLQRIARELQEEEQAAIQRRTAPVVAEQNKLRAEAEQAIKRFWSQSMISLANFFDPNKKTPDWQDALLTAKGARRYQGLCDVNLGQFPTAPAISLEASMAAYESFKRNLSAKSGYVLSEQGFLRVFTFVMVQGDEQQADTGNPEMYMIAFRRLLDLGCYDEAKGEIGYDESLISVREVAPEKPKSFDDVLGDNLSESREGQAAIKAAALADRQSEAYLWYSAWYRSVLDGFGYYLTPDDVKAVTDFMVRMSLPYTRYDSWNRARVWCVHQGLLPSHLLTLDERTADLIQNIDANTYEGKMKIAGLLRAQQ